MFFWRDPLSDADGSPDSARTIFCPVHAVLGGFMECMALHLKHNTTAYQQGINWLIWR
jgi:hypothetical protein